MKRSSLTVAALLLAVLLLARSSAAQSADGHAISLLQVAADGSDGGKGSDGGGGSSSAEKVADDDVKQMDYEGRDAVTEGSMAAALAKAQEGAAGGSKKKREVEWRWKAVTLAGELPSKREGHSAVALEDYIIVFGGCFLDKACFASVELLDTTEKRWRRVKTRGDGPTAREGHSATLVGTHMYVFGGSSEEGYLNDLYVLKAEPGNHGGGNELIMSWGHPDVTGQLPSAREGHSAITYDGRIYVFGGYTERGYSDDLFVLNLDMMAWEKPNVAGTRPKPREGHSAVLYKDRMVVFGGYSDGLVLNDVSVLDLKTLTWLAPDVKGKRPTARQDHSAVVVNDMMIVTAGCNFGAGVCYTDSPVLSLKSLAWKEAPRVSTTAVTPREDHSVTRVRNSLWLIGGCFLAESCFNDAFQLQLDDSVSCRATGCGGHGECRHGVCMCQRGWTGADCTARFSCPRDCSGHGQCIANGFCACASGFAGRDCSQAVTCQHDCHAHGRCRAKDICQCEPGFAGPFCGTTCPGKCHGHGKCVQPADQPQPRAAASDDSFLQLATASRLTAAESSRRAGMTLQASMSSTAALAVQLSQQGKLGMCACFAGWTGAGCGRCDPKTAMCAKIAAGKAEQLSKDAAAAEEAEAEAAYEASKLPPSEAEEAAAAEGEAAAEAEAEREAVGDDSKAAVKEADTSEEAAAAAQVKEAHAAGESSAPAVAKAVEEAGAQTPADMSAAATRLLHGAGTKLNAHGSSSAAHARHGRPAIGSSDVCQDSCSHHGVCRHGHCYCRQGYYGDNCATSAQALKASTMAAGAMAPQAALAVGGVMFLVGALVPAAVARLRAKR
eukprot:PLAT15521.1.p1 GENE.PLAT15521.1~~PLAT15521.1.p1  ORF type:complete len:836 (+),score=438.77 PLAT15521.1:38-2545(+)